MAEKSRVEVINRHLNVINNISKNFRLIINDETEALKITLQYMKSENRLDEVAILLYNEETDEINFILYIDKRGIIEGEEIIPLHSNEKTIYLKMFTTTKKFEYVADSYTIYIPIKIMGNFIGILRATNSLERKSAISTKTISRLVDYADSIAAGLYDVRVSLDRQKNIEKLVAISKIATVMIGTLEIEKVLGIILKNIVNSLGFDRVKLYLIDETAKVINGVISYDIKGKLKSISSEKYPLILRNNHVVNSLAKEQQSVFKGNTKLKQLIKYFPLKVKEQTIGFIEVDNIFSRQQIKKESINYLKLFINQASIAIENARLYKKVENLSIRDGLTGLYTHRYFYQQLEQELTRLKRYGNKMSVIMIDIDHFKKYNDNYGHLVGDTMIKDVAKIIMKNSRESDIAARYGGDEFIILLINTSKEDAMVIAERIKFSIERYSLRHEGEKLHITASFGVSYITKTKVSGKRLIELADKALYKAKDQGRNKICYM